MVPGPESRPGAGRRGSAQVAGTTRDALWRVVRFGGRLMITPDIINGLWPVSRREYHQDHSRIGSSMLKDFRESIPVYAAKYIFGTVPHGDETPEMRLGTA